MQHRTPQTTRLSQQPVSTTTVTFVEFYTSGVKYCVRFLCIHGIISTIWLCTINNFNFYNQISIIQILLGITLTAFAKNEYVRSKRSALIYFYVPGIFNTALRFTNSATNRITHADCRLKRH